MKEAYLDYYRPLVQEFCSRLPSSDLPGLEHLAQPFLPLFGKAYESSSLRILFIGQDTKRWGDCRRFVQQEQQSPCSAIEEAFSDVEALHFRHWGKSTHSFFGFVMAMLASIHGLPNWNVLKWGGYENLLGSFGWANANAIELWGSLTGYTDAVPRETWEAARKASEHLNRFSHIDKTLHPRVVILTVKTVDFDSFFQGYNLVQVPAKEEHINHYRVEGRDLDIFHTYHPGYMRNLGGPRGFLNKIRHTLQKEGLAPDFPDFISDEEAQKEVIQHLVQSAPRPDGNPDRKYEFIAWVADELSKHGALMSVPCLIGIVNECGYRTNYGTEYKGGRGSYRLVSGAYHRQQDEAGRHRIATSFVKPNLTYAYN